MPRPALFSDQQILDAASRLAAANGPKATTIAAIATAVGAPNGSIYHRFQSRDELLGRLWLQKAAFHQDAFAAALAEEAEPQQVAINAALSIPRSVRADLESQDHLSTGRAAAGRKVAATRTAALPTNQRAVLWRHQCRYAGQGKTPIASRSAGCRRHSASMPTIVRCPASRHPARKDSSSIRSYLPIVADTHLQRVRMCNKPTCAFLFVRTQPCEFE